MKIRTQWQLAKEVEEETLIPQDSWDDKWINQKDLVRWIVRNDFASGSMMKEKLLLLFMGVQDE